MSVLERAAAIWERLARRPVDEQPWVVQVRHLNAPNPTWLTVSIFGDSDLPCYFTLREALSAVLVERRRALQSGAVCAFRLLHRSTDQAILMA